MGVINVEIKLWKSGHSVYLEDISFVIMKWARCNYLQMSPYVYTLKKITLKYACE